MAYSYSFAVVSKFWFGSVISTFFFAGILVSHNLTLVAVTIICLVNGSTRSLLYENSEFYFERIFFHPNATIKNTVAVNTIAAPEAMLR